MEEDHHRELKHLCKFCNKSFSCGRSLGGHMRSHLTNNSSELAQEKTARKKLLFGNNGGSETDADTGLVYELRENPKKSWRIADSKEGDSVHDKLCKECGKGFSSWKALFGHMKCHSNKEKASTALEENQSENETSGSNRGKRSNRRKRYMISTPNSSSLSCASVSESEQEQEEAVAMSLIMLSRDVGNWGDLSSFPESSDNNSVIKAKPEAETEQKAKKRNRNSASGTDTDRKLKTAEMGSEQSELQVSGNLKSGSRIKDPEIEDLIAENESDQAQLSSTKIKTQTLSVSSLRSDSGKKSVTEASDSEFINNLNKRSKFECSTCNKVFHSYQALGGHKASHKKLRGIEASINNEAEEDPSSVCDEDSEKKKNNALKLKSSKGHECPICFKVFASGQALGGHKRSHLVANSEGNNNGGIETQNPGREVREFLDLNLPAPVEEEERDSHFVFKAWWIEDSHKPLLGLISN